MGGRGWHCESMAVEVGHCGRLWGRGNCGGAVPAGQIRAAGWGATGVGTLHWGAVEWMASYAHIFTCLFSIYPQ